MYQHECTEHICNIKISTAIQNIREGSNVVWVFVWQNIRKIQPSSSCSYLTGSEQNAGACIIQSIAGKQRTQWEFKNSAENRIIHPFFFSCTPNPKAIKVRTHIKMRIYKIVFVFDWFKLSADFFVKEERSVGRTRIN